MGESAYGQFEATSLYCSRCQRAVPVRKKLLLVLPSGQKYDYLCSVCGAHVGGKLDDRADTFARTIPPGPDPRSRRIRTR